MGFSTVEINKTKALNKIKKSSDVHSASTIEYFHRFPYLKEVVSACESDHGHIILNLKGGQFVDYVITGRNKMETYKEQKARHSKEFGNIEGIFFAFDNKQFAEGMEKIGLKADDTNLICSIGAGGYMLKSKKDDLSALFKRHAEERKNRLKDEQKLIEALAYELNNHEYIITYDPTDALNALGLKKEDIDQSTLKKAIQLAKKGWE